ncbi:TPA: DUF1642 domain-containing protein [Enterococcus faecium]
MNKQELINHIKDQNEWSGNHRFILIKKEELISMIEDLDQPQKVKVPAFMKEFLDFCNKNEQNGLEAYHGLFNICSSWPKDDILQWSFEDPYRFINAFQYGYEVEKEPLYTVTINLDRKYHLVVDEGDGNDEISTTLTTSHGVLGYRYFLTEKEIKSADENLWLIAVPVEEVVEG